jgi:hypothetical protein
MTIRVTSSVSKLISVAHRERSGKKRLHGHTYRIEVFFPAGPDALDLMERLEREAKKLCHSVLPSSLAWAEDLAVHLLGVIPTSTKVEISRAEGFKAVAEHHEPPLPDTHDRERKWWTTREIRELKVMIRNKVPRQTMCRLLGRSLGSIKGQIERSKAAGEI